MGDGSQSVFPGGAFGEQAITEFGVLQVSLVFPDILNDFAIESFKAVGLPLRQKGLCARSVDFPGFLQAPEADHGVIGNRPERVEGAGFVGLRNFGR